MDDDRIRQLTAEVMGALRSGPTAASSPDVEARLARVEAALARIEARLAGLAPGAPVTASPAARLLGVAHPSLQVLAVSGGGDRCVLEPDKPCVQSHACRTLGH